MKMTDEVLSSFIDGELSASEMETVRSRLAEDPALAARIAMITQVDAEVKKHSEGIDRLSLPAGLVERLTRGKAEPGKSSVVSLSLWRRSQHWVQQHQALAASLVVAIAATFLLVNRQATNDNVSALQQALSTVPSGTSITVGHDKELLSHFSFRNHEGSYCRQYRLTVPGSVTENIACLNKGEWETVASMTAENAPQNMSAYQPATADSFLDEVLDRMMAEGPLSLSSEQSLMTRKWETEE